MKRLIALACACCLMFSFAIPCHAEDTDPLPVLYYYLEDDQAIICDFETPYEISLEVPAEIEGYPVTKIGPAAFSFCPELLEITLPDTLTFIDDDAFVNCTALESINIPEGVHTIWEDAFSGCTSLTEIELPSTLTTLGNFAFSGCDNLTSINIPDGVTSMGVGALGSCPALTEISVPGSLAVLEDALFAGSTGLETVHLSEGITEISDSVFFCCDNLKEITIPASVTKIGNTVFSYSGVEEIHFLGDAPSFSEEAFYDLTATVYYPAGNDTWTQDVMQNYCGNIAWKEETSILKGDVNGDGRINIGDVSKLYGYIKKTTSLSEEALQAAEFTGDGRINIGDVSKLYAYIKNGQ